jgi:glycerol-3-phosphate dehydrogenase (NAD(P)+)
MRVAVIGGGSWGTALAGVLGRKGHRVAVWAHDPEVAASLRERKANERYLPGIVLEGEVTGTTSLAEALEGAELVVAVSPSHVTRAVMAGAVPHLPPNVPIVCATKGIETDTLMTMSEVLEDVLPPERHPYVAFLSGPSFAVEVARGLPTAVVVAARWERIAKIVQQAFSVPFFRVYTSPEVGGVELGGALKNVVAIAAGVADGLGYGHNARSGLITRGLAEIGRLAVRRGAHPMTLSGLAGMGDLVLTCTGELSRNRQVGLRLGQGERIEPILASMRQVAEGVRTAQSAHALALKMGVEMPITDAVYATLYEGVTAPEAVQALLARELKAEFT